VIASETLKSFLRAPESFLSGTFKKVEKELLEKVVPAWNMKIIH
jgi:hypothetical protein